MATKKTNNKNNNVNNNETRFICPNCGAEFAIPEHTSVGIGIMPGKDSNLGTVPLPLAEGSHRKSKAQERIEALRKAGVNTDGLIAVQLGGTLGETIGRVIDGAISVLADDDPIYQLIISQGTIPNRRLFRRWVMAQMFHILASGKSVTDCVKGMDYNYTWRMLSDELHAQVKLENNDPENFIIRNQWFNKNIASEMADDYIARLNEYIDGLTIRHCQGKEYKRIHGSDYFISDIPSKLMLPLYSAQRSIRFAKNPAALAKAVDNFRNKMVTLVWSTNNSKCWMDAYKGVGAYYTMENLIRFHGCRIVNDNGVVLDEDKSIAYIKAKSNEYRIGGGWRMIGLMKKLLEDNGVNIKAKILEWRKAKSRR